MSGTQYVLAALVALPLAALTVVVLFLGIALAVKLRRDWLGVLVGVLAYLASMTMAVGGAWLAGVWLA